MAVMGKGRRGEFSLSKSKLSDFQRLLAVLLLIFALSLIYSFISSLSFTNTGLPGFIGVNPAAPIVLPVHPVPASFASSKMDNLNSMSNPATIPVYFVQGLNSYTYLMRLYTSAYYDPVTHVWIGEKMSYTKMHAAPYTVRYKVTPIIAFRGNIPVSQKTFFVTLKNAKYSPETSTFYVIYDKKPYTAFSSANPNPKSFQIAQAPSKYLQVNCYGKEAIRSLALKVTKDAKNDYEKAERIAEFLKTNYKYGFTTYSDHPIYDFLFVKKVGVCKNFASAFVMMCRSIGLPARMVFGYMARPVPYNQTVFLSQAHAWAEVKFKGGWVEFNPTPPPKKISTETEITQISKEVYAGSNLTLSGYVRVADSNYTYMQKYLSGYVEIYLAKNKNNRSSYQFLTIVPVKAGHFYASVRVNKTGEYNVLAHYTGSFMFYSSWSDPIVKILGKPYIVTNIGKIVATNCYIRGSVEYTKPVNGTMYLYVDNTPYYERFNHSFLFKIKLSKGVHILRFYYPGSSKYFIASASLEKKVIAGNVTLKINNTTAIAGNFWTAKCSLFFNGKPLNDRVKLIIGQPFNENVVMFGNVSFSLRAPKKAGVYFVKIEIPSMGFIKTVKVFVKSVTHIEASIRGNTLIVRVLDSSGNLVSGKIYINKKVYTDSGVLKVQLKEMPDKITIFYPGDKVHLPSKIEISKPLPVWIYLLPLPLIAFVALKLRKRKTLVFHYTPPLVWLPGDTIEIRALGEGIVRIKVDGKDYGFGKGEAMFKGELGEGEHKIEAEILNERGKLLERGKLVFYVLPFRRAIAKIFESVIECGEKKTKESFKNYTAREVLDKLEVEENLKKELLSFFEPNRYGFKVKGTRKDIENFYLLCRKVIENAGC